MKIILSHREISVSANTDRTEVIVNCPAVAGAVCATLGRSEALTLARMLRQAVDMTEPRAPDARAGVVEYPDVP